MRCARAVRALCEKLAVLHHREFGKLGGYGYYPVYFEKCT